MSRWKDFIGCDPKICHGKPCFKINGKISRIMVFLVLEMLEAKESFEDILEAYPHLTSQHIQAALHYAVEMTKTGEMISLANIS